MAIVYEFPKKKLPAVVEERLHKCAEDYIEVLEFTMQAMGVSEMSESDYNEVVELVANAYAEGIIKAANKMD